jgi:3',5'-cyclic AMP phosphodiesterase CpdA
MRLVVTADLHYELAEHRPAVHAVAERICREKADALALAGDLFAHSPDCLRQCLRLFEGFQGEKFLIAGNHDLWTEAGDSFEIYDQLIPAVAAECGFRDLDAAPSILGDVGLVGTIGWYDYSFRDESLGIPLRFYELKAAPGYALAHPALRELVDPNATLPFKALAARSYWNDGRMVRWKLDDPTFNALTIERLEGQLRAVEGQVRAVVAITHHLPFAEMLVRRDDPSWAFGNAFMGSAGLGQALLRHPKVTHAVFGHSHSRDHQRIGHIEAINVGCTYRKKRYDVLDV